MQHCILQFISKGLGAWDIAVPTNYYNFNLWFTRQRRAVPRGAVSLLSIQEQYCQWTNWPCIPEYSIWNVHKAKQLVPEGGPCTSPISDHNERTPSPATHTTQPNSRMQWVSAHQEACQAPPMEQAVEENNQLWPPVHLGPYWLSR